jgi:hypothetical protein
MANRESRQDHAPTASQLKDDIDSGRTGDKVAVIDPAMAPLGTDAEAAGTPPSRQELLMAQGAETSRNRTGKPPEWSGVLWWLGGVSFGILMVAAGYFSPG